MEKMRVPWLFHCYSRCERCESMADCVLNIALDRWLCADCVMELPFAYKRYCWSGLGEITV